MNHVNEKMIKDRRRYCNWKEGAVGNDPVANTD
jgi:hypothetical protein